MSVKFGTEENMILARQQRLFAQLRQQANGDISVVERALIAATTEAKGPPPMAKVIAKIQEIQGKKKELVANDS